MNVILASLQSACDKLKLSATQVNDLRTAIAQPSESLLAENAKLKALLDEVARLIHASGHERIIHDLRNVLNELVLLQALSAQSEDAQKV